MADEQVVGGSPPVSFAANSPPEGVPPTAVIPDVSNGCNSMRVPPAVRAKLYASPPTFEAETWEDWLASSPVTLADLPRSEEYDAHRLIYSWAKEEYFQVLCIFRIFDHNCDGFLDCSEFCALVDRLQDCCPCTPSDPSRWTSSAGVWAQLCRDLGCGTERGLCLYDLGRLYCELHRRDLGRDHAAVQALPPPRRPQLSSVDTVCQVIAGMNAGAAGSSSATPHTPQRRNGRRSSLPEALLSSVRRMSLPSSAGSHHTSSSTNRAASREAAAAAAATTPMSAAMEMEFEWLWSRSQTAVNCASAAVDEDLSAAVAEQLRRLWCDAGLGSATAPPIRSDARMHGCDGNDSASVSPSPATLGWRKLGFQTMNDPCSDFRGGGLLALDCLCALGRNDDQPIGICKEEQIAFWDHETIREGWLQREVQLSQECCPFALCSIRVTHMLCSLLEISFEGTVLAAAQHRFSALFATAMMIPKPTAAATSEREHSVPEPEPKDAPTSGASGSPEPGPPKKLARRVSHDPSNSNMSTVTPHTPGRAFIRLHDACTRLFIGAWRRRLSALGATGGEGGVGMPWQDFDSMVVELRRMTAQLLLELAPTNSDASGAAREEEVDSSEEEDDSPDTDICPGIDASVLNRWIGSSLAMLSSVAAADADELRAGGRTRRRSSLPGIFGGYRKSSKSPAAIASIDAVPSGAAPSETARRRSHMSPSGWLAEKRRGSMQDDWRAFLADDAQPATTVERARGQSRRMSLPS